MIKTNGKIQLTAPAAVARAVEMAARVKGGTRAGYKLGSGGRGPADTDPLNDIGQCDCSGFIAWACGYDRFQGYDAKQEERWVNTDAILYAAKPSAVEHGFETTAAIDYDGGHANPMFRPVHLDENVLPGDLLVYGSKHVAKERVPGHVGMVTSVGSTFKRLGPGWWLLLSVAHCSPSNSTKFGSGHAIAVTDARIWRKKGTLVRPTFYAS